MKDWQECRNSIGRFDSILVDLRKVGFSIITGLLTAGSFLGFLGIGSKDSAVPPPGVNGAVFIAIMVLVAALYSVDTNFQVLLIGAVQRAQKIESLTYPRIEITKHLSDIARVSKVHYVTLFLYLVLLLVSAGLGLMATGAVNPSEIELMPALYSVGISGVVAVIAWVAFWHSYRWKAVAGATGLWITLSVAALLALSVWTSPNVNVALWVIGSGTLLALFIQFYWIYVDKQVGLTQG